MLRRIIIGTAGALALTLGALVAAFAQFAPPQPVAIEAWARELGADELWADELWAHDFTVLTMAPDGAWGTATDPRINRAIHLAIGNCKIMSGAELGCGAYLTTVRGGWSLGIRCGGENIIAADRNLAVAERRAHEREIELRARYVPGMPPCARVVTVDPNGNVLMPAVGQATGPRSTRQLPGTP